METVLVNYSHLELELLNTEFLIMLLTMPNPQPIQVFLVMIQGVLTGVLMLNSLTDPFFQMAGPMGSMH